MNIVPLVEEGLGNTSWLVDLEDGRALVVDPSRHSAPYLAAAERTGLAVAFSAETHLHADFVSGSRDLLRRGATVLAPRSAGIEFPHRGLSDGEEVDVGGLTLRAVSTPGHTPEHLAYLLLDGDEAQALFSGGSLLVGSVARTDLIDPERTEQLTRSLYRSITRRLLSLPDALPVYPTHGAGSFCTPASGRGRTTTIGEERRTNPLLAAPDEDTFVTRLLASLGSFPPYFLRLREVNRRGPRPLEGLPALGDLGPKEVQHLVEDGAEVVDVRPVDQFAAGHLRGSLSVPLRPQLASWIGWLVDPGRPLVFVLGPAQDPGEVVRQCLLIGHDELAGQLGGGVDAWVAEGLAVERMATETPEHLDVTGTASVVDVRQQAEFDAGHVPGSFHVELGSLTSGSAVLPDGPLVTLCGHGERAATAASLLARSGRHDVSIVLGGPEDWAEARGRSLVEAR